jgi:hypothetical protein
MFKRIVQFTVWSLLILIALGGCAKVNTSTGGGSAVTTPTDPGDDTTSTDLSLPSNAIFNVAVKTIWDTDPNLNESSWQNCLVTSGSAASSSCSVAVPEAQMFHSSLRMSVTIKEGYCDVLDFNPYIYQQSTLAAYTPPGSGGAIDCSGLTPPIGCFSGAGVELVTDYPLNIGTYYLAAHGLTVDYDFISGDTKRVRDSLTINNRWMSNNLPVGQRGIAQANYVANSMQDWTFICKDEYDETLYQLTINLTDTDGATDTIADWQ